MHSPVKSIQRWTRKYRINYESNRLTALENAAKKASTASEVAAQARNAATRNPDTTPLDRARLEYRASQASLRGRKANLRLEAYRKTIERRTQIRAKKAEKRAIKNTRRAENRVARRRRWNEAVARNSLRWQNLRNRFTNAIAKHRQSIEERIASIETGSRSLRTLRTVIITVAEYTVLAIYLPVIGVGAVIEGVMQMIGAMGSWLLSHASGALSRFWSGLWNAAAWTVWAILLIAFVLTASIIEGVLALLSAVLWVVVWPFSRITAGSRGRRERRAMREARRKEATIRVAPSPVVTTA